MTDLTQQKCVPCEGGVPAMREEEIKDALTEVPAWEVTEVAGVPHLVRSFDFDDFKSALDFTNTIGALAEEEGHHPLIILTWGKVTIEWWTHAIEGLHQNDFIMAAKSSQAYDPS